VVAGDAIPYEDADGTPLPWPSFEAEHDLGGRVPGYVVRRLESQGARVRVETISSEATPTDGCGVGIVGLDPFALQFWVDDDALLEVVTERTRFSYPDATTVELLAGTPVREAESGVWVADAWGVTLDLASEPTKRSRTFPGLDHLTGTVKGHLEPDAKLRVGDALAPSFMLRSDDEGIVHFGRDRGLFWVQLPCAQLLAVPSESVEATMPTSIGLAGGGRGSGVDAKFGIHVVDEGAPLTWSDGKVAGRARRRVVMAGERFDGPTPQRPCYEQRFANGARALLLCPDPERSQEVAWISVDVSAAKVAPKSKRAAAESTDTVDPALRARTAVGSVRTCTALGLAGGHALADTARLELELHRAQPGEPFTVARLDGRVFADGAADREAKRCVREAIDDRRMAAPGFVEATYAVATAK